MRKALTAFWLAMVIAVVGVPSSLNAQVPPTIAKPVVLPPAILPPDVVFDRFIALIRGHLLTGDELVKQRDWQVAHPHFMFPLEEIYGVIRDDLRGYKTPPFDGALKSLARTVAAHNDKQYPKALERVENALAAADADPVGYRTARGFILQADRMIESVAGDLEAKNSDALREMREGFAQLKQAFAAMNAPKRPPIEDATMLAIVSRVELAAGKLE